MKKRLMHALALMAALALVLTACQPAATEAPKDFSKITSAADAGGMDALVAAAKAEGTVTTIALPHDWCNYGEVIEQFKAKYGLQVNELDPNAGSNDELEAVKANKDNKGPQAPDVVDVGLAFGPQAKTEQLISLYKVSTWDSIPASAKDADGYWYGDYYGVLAFEVNANVVTNIPQDWSDLLKPEYKGQVALAGDPRSSNQAIQAVYAAALATGGSLDNAEPGLQFFKQLNEAGNFVPVIAKPGTIAQGETPITIRWTYNALSNRDALAGNPPIEVVVPASGRFAGVYVQAVSAYAPHPAAARLWMEFLYSDEGQTLWLKGYCHPIRYEDLLARKAVPQDLLDKLPEVTGAVFPSLAQLDAAKKAITENWDAVVGADVK
ncbi:MAG: ABC transporter substrate binding protein precursor [Anaerolineales bacterium]|nr:ABC transporter substrate binding protein precursor [Anaerolineales bacterium]